MAAKERMIHGNNPGFGIVASIFKAAAKHTKVPEIENILKSTNRCLSTTSSYGMASNIWFLENIEMSRFTVVL